MASEQRSLTANFTANASGFAQGSNEVIQHLRELNTEMANVRNQIKETNQQVRQYEQRLEELRRATNNGESATEDQRREMQQLEDAIAQCNVDLGSHRTAQQRLQSEIRSTNRRLDEMRSGTMTVSQAFTNMGTVLKANLLSGAIQTALSEIVQLLRTTVTYCYDVGSQFEAGMSQVAAISGATGAELEALTAKAKEMGASTKFTATQAAEALNYMAMAGWKTEDMLSGIDGVINLAAASGEDLGTVSDIVTDALTAFGLSAKDSAHFADVLAAASANSNTNVAMMGETFTYCAPIAGALGYSIEDTATAIGIMANSGIKASQAGTALRTIMTNLSSDVTIAGEKIGEVTIKTTNADGSMREFTDIIADLRGAFSGLTESEKTAAAENIAGKYAMSGFLALVNAAESDVAALSDVINNCEGATADMAETMQNNLAGKVTIMQSAFEGLGISMYDTFGEGVSETVDMLTESIGKLDEKVKGGALDSSVDNLNDSLVELVDELTDAGEEAIPDFINGVADVISFVIEFRDVIGGAISTFVAYKTTMATLNITTAVGGSIQSLIGMFKNLRTATEAATTAQVANNTAAAANPYMAVALAVGVLVGAVTTYIGSVDDCNERMQEMQRNSEELIDSADDYKESAEGLTDIKDKYEDIAKSTQNAVDKKIALRKIQQELIDKYGSEAAGIDLVTGAYEDQIGAIQQLIDKNNTLAKAQAQAALDEAQAAEKEATSIGHRVVSVTDSWGFESGQAHEELWKFLSSGSLSTFNAQANATGFDYKFTGTYEERERDFEKLYNYLTDMGWQNTDFGKDVLAQWETMRNSKNELVALEERAAAYTTTNYVEEHYNPTEHYRQKDLEAQARATASVVEEVADGIAAKMEETEEALADPIKEGLEEIKTEFEKTLDAIDAEIERRNRAKQDSELKEKIDAVTARLAYEQLDEFSRRSLEKELQELNEERADIAFERQTTDSKVALRNAYDATQSLANAVPEGYNARAWVDTLDRAFSEISQGYMPNSTVKDQAEASAVYNIVINAQDKTPQQIYNEIKGYFGGGI